MICYLILGLFYYVLGNIQPKYRSTLKAIQLIAAITCPLLKEYGYEHALKPFIEDMKKMRQVCINLCFFILNFYLLM